jgi:hypothetical protein
VQIASRSVQGIQSPVEMMKHASYWILSCVQLTKGDPPAWYLCKG